jgi:hypothetical protein
MMQMHVVLMIRLAGNSHFSYCLELTLLLLVVGLLLVLAAVDGHVDRTARRALSRGVRQNAKTGNLSN